MKEQYTTRQVAEREKVSRQRITELAREARITGTHKHGPNYAFDADYRILPAPQRPKPRKAELAKKRKAKR